MYPLCGSFIICQSSIPQSGCMKKSYSYLESEYSFQATQRLSDDCEHIKESILKVLLNRFKVSIRSCDLELRGECIACPEACPREKKIEQGLKLARI